MRRINTGFGDGDLIMANHNSIVGIKRCHILQSHENLPSMFSMFQYPVYGLIKVIEYGENS